MSGRELIGRTVYGEHYPVSAATAHSRLADHPADERHTDHVEHLCGDGQPVHRPDGTPPIPIAGAADCIARVDCELKPDMGMQQCKCADDILDGSDLGWHRT